MSALANLREQLALWDGISVGSSTIAVTAGAPGIGATANGRDEQAASRYELLSEAIYEGYLLHYRQSRLLELDDEDLALLAGDRLYAAGLQELAELGDLEAVRLLAEVIGLCAKSHAEGDDALATAAWRAGMTALGWGSTDRHEEAKQAVRDGAPGALARLLESAER